MIAASRRWFRRNRTNLVIGAGVVGAGYLAGQYVLGKIQEARQRMSEERTGRENLRRRFEQNQEDCTYTVLALLPTVGDEIITALPVEQITEQLQQERQDRLRRLGASEVASSEFPSAPPSVTDRDDASLQSSSYVHASQMTAEGSTSLPRPKRSKAQLWQDMKINSIARALTLLYTLSLLTLLTRIQLNLLGRRTYLSSVVALASPPEPTQASKISLENRDDDNYDHVYGNDFETNRKYLTFSWWLLHRGSKELLERVTAAVKEIFASVNIREDMALERIAGLVMDVRRKIEGATEDERRSTRWLQYLLPPKEQEGFVIRQSGMSESEESPTIDEQDADPMGQEEISTSLRRLLDETSDLIDSPTFTHVLTQTLDASFSHLVDYRIATEAFKAAVPSIPSFNDSLLEQRVTEIVDSKCKLANILPVFCKQAHVIAVGSGELDTLADVATQEGVGLGNEYLAAVNKVQDLEAFAAVIYSSNFEYGAQEDDGPSSQQRTQAEQPTNAQEPAGNSGLKASIPPTSPTVEKVPETKLEDVSASILGESEVVVPSTAATESEPAALGEATGSKFEAAWKNATSESGGNAQ